MPFISGFLNIAQNGVRTIEIEPTENIVIEEVKPPTEAYSVQETEDSIVLPDAKQTYEWDNADIVKLPYDFSKAIECESRWKHLDENGEPLMHYNKNGTYDIGVGQVNSVHAERAEELGYDLRDKNDNLRMALLIYEEQGIGAFYGYDPDRDKCSYE